MKGLRVEITQLRNDLEESRLINYFLVFLMFIPFFFYRNLAVFMMIFYLGHLF